MLRFLQRISQPFSRHPFASAVTLSLLVHFYILWDGEFELPDFMPEAPDEVLSKKKADSIPRIKLNIKPPARPKAQVGATIVTLVEEAPPEQVPAAAPIKPKAAKKQTAKAPTKKEKIEEPLSRLSEPIHTANTTPEDKPQTDNQSEGSPHGSAVPLGDTLPPPPEELAKAPVAPAYEPPPSFPIEIAANYKASFKGFAVTIKQIWRMEGESYLIENEASKFGFKARMVSEGRVSNNGISPERYRMYLNNKLRSFADIDRSTRSIRHGRSDEVKFAVIQDDIQDAASLPFQVAVNFDGVESKQMQVTTGSAVYLIELKLLSEEVLKLPAGEVRTLHLQGQRINVNTGLAQQGYDVWLAPDYRNFPVKFRGPTSQGEVLEYSIRSLSFEGETVLGKNLKAEVEAPDTDTLPPEFFNSPESKPKQPMISVGDDAP